MTEEMPKKYKQINILKGGNMGAGSYDPNLTTKYRTQEPNIGVGELGEKIAEEILNSEGFKDVKMQEKMSQHQPFDGICRKSGKLYIVEVKTAKRGLGCTPNRTQKKHEAGFRKSAGFTCGAFASSD